MLNLVYSTVIYLELPEHLARSFFADISEKKKKQQPKKQTKPLNNECKTYLKMFHFGKKEV